MVTQAGEGLVLGSQPRPIPVWRGPSFSQFLGLPNLPEICYLQLIRATGVIVARQHALHSGHDIVLLCLSGGPFVHLSNACIVSKHILTKFF